MLTPSNEFTHCFISVSSRVSHYFVRTTFAVALPALARAAQTQHHPMLSAFACRFAHRLRSDALESLHAPVTLSHPSGALVAWIMLTTPPVPVSSYFRDLGATFGEAGIQLMG